MPFGLAGLFGSDSNAQAQTNAHAGGSSGTGSISEVRVSSDQWYLQQIQRQQEMLNHSRIIREQQYQALMNGGRSGQNQYYNAQPPSGSTSIQSGAAISLMNRDLSAEFDRYLEIVDAKLP